MQKKTTQHMFTNKFGGKVVHDPWKKPLDPDHLPLGLDGPVCGLRVCKNGPAPFPGWMSYCRTRRLNQVWFCFISYFILYHYTVLLFIRAHVLLVCVGMCSVFWLFWLSFSEYLPSDWLERLLWGSLTVARGRLQKAEAEECLRYDLLVYSIVSLFSCMVVLFLCPTWYALYFYGTI